ncbi:hypothetical protein [Streptomyces nitrosporeus]|uniref:hypothetical protein n=1 Tax=Streptomyces nitrosporeus TaxID=28894 RepID=UPI0039A049B3
MDRQRSKGRVTLAAAAAMCAVAVLPGQAHAAGGPEAYAFDPAAKTVSGTRTNAGAPELKSGSVYRSSIEAGEKLYYRVELDQVTNAFVSAVAVPRQAGKAAYGDGVKVSLRNLDDLACGSGNANFGSAEFTRPIAAYAHRIVEPGEGGTGTCGEAGTYNVLVERESKASSDPGTWDLELRFASEPALRSGVSKPTEAPEDWPSSSPTPPSGRQERSGGSSYHTATGLETGEWADTVAPGQTLFYRVPVDWGQQLFATAALSNSEGGESAEFLGSALALSLDNPVLGHVDGATTSYAGKPASVALDPLPPVAYENRYDFASDVSAMAFAGWYYLSVALDPEVAEHYGDTPVELTLRVSVTGKAGESPYAGDAGVFGVSGEDREMARNGQSAPEAEKSGTMTVVAASGIGTGTVLVLGLGVWTLLGRRRSPAPQAVPPAPQPPFGGAPPPAR